MTLCKGKFLFQTFLFHQNNCRFISLTPLKTSRYDKRYIDPIIDKEVLSQPIDEHDPRRYQPIKAAKTEDTTAFYYDSTVQTFCNKMMNDGKKAAARRTLDLTLENIKRIQLEKYHKCSSDSEKEALVLDPVKVLHKAIDHCKPVLTIKFVEKGGVRYKVPSPCPPQKQTYLAMKWLIETSKELDRKKRMYVKLAHEIVDAANKEGKAMRKKQELHRVCEENRAYAHFRWSR